MSLCVHQTLFHLVLFMVVIVKCVGYNFFLDNLVETTLSRKRRLAKFLMSLKIYPVIY